jgi:hypothetical protein
MKDELFCAAIKASGVVVVIKLIIVASSYHIPI